MPLLLLLRLLLLLYRGQIVPLSRLVCRSHVEKDGGAHGHVTAAATPSVRVVNEAAKEYDAATPEVRVVM